MNATEELKRLQEMEERVKTFMAAASRDDGGYVVYDAAAVADVMAVIVTGKTVPRPDGYWERRHANIIAALRGGGSVVLSCPVAEPK